MRGEDTLRKGGVVESETPMAPPLGGLHHVGLTVADVEASEAWYSRVLGLRRAFVEQHNGGTGYAVVMHRPGTALFLGLDRHPSYVGERFAEDRTGLDHLAIHVGSRNALDDWAAHFDALGVPHGAITDVAEPMRFATLVIRDPDNIQLELIWQ